MAEMQQESPIEIENILILESSFNRIYNVLFDDELFEVHTNLNVDVSAHNDETRVVTLAFEYYQEVISTRERQVTLKVKQVGVFNKKASTGELDFNLFARVNAPAIMFPYLRELVTNMSIRAGMSPIYIPPVNFIALDKQNNSEQEKS